MMSTRHRKRTEAEAYWQGEVVAYQALCRAKRAPSHTALSRNRAYAVRGLHQAKQAAKFIARAVA